MSLSAARHNELYLSSTPFVLGCSVPVPICSVYKVSRPTDGAPPADDLPIRSDEALRRPASAICRRYTTLERVLIASPQRRRSSASSAPARELHVHYNEQHVYTVPAPVRLAIVRARACHCSRVKHR